MKHEWMFDEYAACGTDYHAAPEAGRFEQEHGAFRDFDEEAAELVRLAGITSSDVVIDIGAGTGALSARIAPHCRRLYAVDVSRAMLDKLQDRIREDRIENITCIRAGFLSYEHKDEPADVVLSTVALHHLPDVWKLIALENTCRWLKPRGRLLLRDVVFADSGHGHLDRLAHQADEMLNLIPEHRQRALRHLSREFSTFDWIMRGLLTRAGLTIHDVRTDREWLRTYICQKQDPK